MNLSHQCEALKTVRQKEQSKVKQALTNPAFHRRSRKRSGQRRKAKATQECAASHKWTLGWCSSPNTYNLGQSSAYLSNS